MSVLAAKLIRLIYGDIYLQEQNESKQKRPPWQEAVFRLVENLGRLSPQGGDLVLKILDLFDLIISKISRVQQVLTVYRLQLSKLHDPSFLV